jgi:four helix bundle protein
MKIDITDRTFAFALRVVKLCRSLEEGRMVHRALVNQLIRAGTSVGANVEEAQSGQSRADFLSKISIACKEAREAHYWLRLIAASDDSLVKRMSDVIQEANELVSILTSIIKNTKANRE